MFFAEGGEVEVDEGWFERGVAEVGGELVKLGATFEHVGGVGVPEGVSGYFLVLLAEAAFGGGDFDDAPDAGLGHVMAAVVKGLAEGDA